MNSWQSLKAKCSTCQACSLAKSRNKLVFDRFAQGLQNLDDCKILFVGEAPGAREDLEGSCFVGRSGQLLDQALAECEISSYILINSIKCRPPANRRPKSQEILACRPWLDKQVKLLAPKIIVCLGLTAYEAMLGQKLTIKNSLGKISYFQDYPLTVVFHPAYILRQRSRYQEWLETLAQIKEDYAL